LEASRSHGATAASSWSFWKVDSGGTLSEDLEYLSGFTGGTEPYPSWQATTSDSASFGDLFGLFGVGSVILPGHYTFHVRSGSGGESYQKDHTILVLQGDDEPGDPPNTAPTVVITSPMDGAEFESGAGITFMGFADDAEDGDLTGDLVWESSLDGEIGEGGSFSADLSEGDHVITASVIDSDGVTGSATITIQAG
jgi:hypothetical protein